MGRNNGKTINSLEELGLEFGIKPNGKELSEKEILNDLIKN